MAKFVFFGLIDVIRRSDNLREYSHAQQHLLAVTYDFTADLFPHYQTRPDPIGTVPGHRPNSVNFLNATQNNPTVYFDQGFMFRI